MIPGLHGRLKSENGIYGAISRIKNMLLSEVITAYGQS